MDVAGLITLLVYIVVIGAILWIVWWGISQVPMAEPIATVVKVVFVLIVCLLAISMLLQLLPGGGSFKLFPR